MYALVVDNDVDSKPPGNEVALVSQPKAPAGPTRLSIWRWLWEGTRATVFLKPRIGDALPTPWQVLVVFVLAQLLIIGVARLSVPGPAMFVHQVWMAELWPEPFLLWCGWMLLRREGNTSRLGAWYALHKWASCMTVLVYAVLLIGIMISPLVKPYVPNDLRQFVAEHFRTIQWSFTAWQWAVVAWLGRSFFARLWHRLFFALFIALILVLELAFSPGALWHRDYSALRNEAELEDEHQIQFLTQEIFESQQALWAAQSGAIKASRAGVADVYGIVFAPYADEDVFMRESHLVRKVLEQRFDAEGRVIELLNNASTAETHVWATPLNLQRAVDVLAKRMDRDRDVLVVYLTSHGGADHHLASSHWPLSVESLRAEQLRDMLDKAGIRQRVIAVSACYSGGWIEPLKNDDTLIMTAADATHTSYGCGSRSELTFFGRALFDEQLAQTHSFQKAFEAAVPVIKKREEEAGKEDFSNPQISVGSKIAVVLEQLEKRLDKADRPR